MYNRRLEYISKKEQQMRIMLIDPGVLPAENFKWQLDYARSVCSPGTSIEQFKVNTVGPAPSDFTQFALFVPDLLQKVKQAEKEKYDAVCIDCFTDMGLEFAKIAANIPVVGPCESSLHLACQLAGRIGWITPMDVGIPYHWRQVRSYGLADRITDIRAINVSLEDFHDKRDESEAKLLALARDLVKGGAELILVGCNGIFAAMGAGSSKRFADKLGVTTIEPLATMIQTAEMLVRLKVCHSSIAYPKTSNL
jgi:allantoin racemase